MKKLLALTLLFISPAYAGFDFGKILEDVVGEVVNTVLLPSGERGSTDVGSLLGNTENAERYNEIVRFYNDETLKVAPVKYELEPYIKDEKEYCPEKYSTKRCQYAKEQLYVMKGHMIRKRLGALTNQYKYADRPAFSSDQSLKYLAEAEDLIQQYKAGNYLNGRTRADVEQDIFAENDIVSSKNRAKQKLESELAKEAIIAEQRAMVKNNIDIVKAGPFNKPYKACIAEGEKMISMVRLINSGAMTDEKITEANMVIQENCGCTYIVIHQNAISASNSDKRDLADDLSKIESNKMKISEMSKWEIELFRARFKNADISWLAYANTTLRCQ